MAHSLLHIFVFNEALKRLLTIKALKKEGWVLKYAFSVFRHVGKGVCSNPLLASKRFIHHLINIHFK